MFAFLTRSLSLFLSFSVWTNSGVSRSPLFRTVYVVGCIESKKRATVRTKSADLWHGRGNIFNASRIGLNVSETWGTRSSYLAEDARLRNFAWQWIFSRDKLFSNVPQSGRGIEISWLIEAPREFVASFRRGLNFSSKFSLSFSFFWPKAPREFHSVVTQQRMLYNNALPRGCRIWLLDI